MKPAHEVYVSNLAWHATAEDLRRVFSAVGEVVDVRIMLDPVDKRPRGFAFVGMAGEDAARRAIETMNGTVVCGRPIRVSVANSRAPKRGATYRGIGGE